MFRHILVEYRGDVFSQVFDLVSFFHAVSIPLRVTQSIATCCNCWTHQIWLPFACQFRLGEITNSLNCTSADT